MTAGYTITWDKLGSGSETHRENLVIASHFCPVLLHCYSIPNRTRFFADLREQTQESVISDMGQNDAAPIEHQSDIKQIRLEYYLKKGGPIAFDIFSSIANRVSAWILPEFLAPFVVAGA